MDLNAELAGQHVDGGLLDFAVTVSVCYTSERDQGRIASAGRSDSRSADIFCSPTLTEVSKQTANTDHEKSHRKLPCGFKKNMRPVSSAGPNGKLLTATYTFGGE